VLVGRIGPDRAAYSTVLFPVVALSVSTVLEGYHWTLPAFGGVALVLGGNLLAFMKPAAISVAPPDGPDAPRVAG
jgi:drug/metabolite transporter (DMT)-like permease